VETLTSTTEVSQIKITAEQFEEDCTRLSTHIIRKGKQYKGIYAIPKNGMYVAHYLSKHLGIPIVQFPGPEILVVDDLVDSGHTLRDFPYDKAVLYVKNGNVDKVTYFVEAWSSSPWIKFFFEKDTDIQEHIRRMLEYIGEDPTREGLIDTPKRVVKSWSRLYGGYKQKAEDILTTTFAEIGDYDQMVVLRDIDFFSTCEHHMINFSGRAHVAYLPDNKVVGISKLARLVDMHARRLQIQERMTNDIAQDLQRILQPKGVAVLVEGGHFCMKARGVEQLNSVMVTSKLTGCFKEEPATRAEFFKLIGK